MDLNYYDTLIAVAEDCPVSESVAPAARGDKVTIAMLQYGMLSEAPFTRTQEDILFETWLFRQEFPAPLSAAEIAKLRLAFFEKPQACLRSSPLPKRHGFGFLFDREGKVALCPMDSDEYQRLVRGDDAGITILKAMRSRRA